MCSIMNWSRIMEALSHIWQHIYLGWSSWSFVSFYGTSTGIAREVRLLRNIYKHNIHGFCMSTLKQLHCVLNFRGPEITILIEGFLICFFLCVWLVYVVDRKVSGMCKKNKYKFITDIYNIYPLGKVERSINHNRIPIHDLPPDL